MIINFLGFVFTTEEKYNETLQNRFELGYDVGKCAQKHNTGVVRDPVTGRFVSADKCSNPTDVLTYGYSAVKAESGIIGQ